MTDATDAAQPKAPEDAAAAPAAAAPASAFARAGTLLSSAWSGFSSGARNAVSARHLALGAAAVLGLAGGAAATSAYYEMSAPKAAPFTGSSALSETVPRLETNVAALSTSVGAATKASSGQWAKIGERLDKLEKSAAEPASRLAALTDTVEKLRAAAANAKAAPTDVTGSIAAPERPAAEPQKPVLSGWTLHEVDRGMATVEGRQGVFDVVVGDPLPGLDRVEAIRRQQGRWVVVTRKGIIVAR